MDFGTSFFGGKPGIIQNGVNRVPGGCRMENSLLQASWVYRKFF